MRNALLSLMIFSLSFSALALDSIPNDQRNLACLSRDINLISRSSATILVVDNVMGQAPTITAIKVNTTPGVPATFLGQTEYRNVTLEHRIFGKFALVAFDADGNKELSLTFRPAYEREFNAVYRAGSEREVLNCKFD